MTTRFLRREIISDLRPSPDVCAFCGVAAPCYEYAAHRTATDLAVRCWRWPACAACAAHIESDNFAPLILQLTDALWRNSNHVLPPKAIRQAVDLAIGEFRRYAVRNPQHLYG